MTSEQFTKWRESLGWSKTKVAQELGVTRQTVWFWETHGLGDRSRVIELACERLSAIQVDRIRAA